MVLDLPPDMISSVMSRPPWFGSRILIYWSKNMGYVTCNKQSNVCINPITANLQLPHINAIVIFSFRESSGLTRQMLSVHSFFFFKPQTRDTLPFCWDITGLRSLFGGPCDCAGGCWGGGACCCCWAGLIMTGAGWTDGEYCGCAG